MARALLGTIHPLKEAEKLATMTQPAPGMRVKKTTYTEVIPPEDRSPSDAQPSAFYADDWENVVQKLTPDQWQGHIMRVYRADEKWDRSSSPIDNTFTSSFTEEDLRKRFGGGRFLLWLYGPPKRQTLLAKYRATLDGDPIVNTIPRNPQAGVGSETVALEAMRMYANPEFVRMQMQMMVTAATEAMALIKSQMPQAQDPLQTLRNAKEILGIGGPNPMDEINKMLMQAMVQKLLNPPETNSLDATLSLVDKIKNSGLFGGTPKADLAATFANNLPMLVDRMVSGLHEFRLRAESEERAIRLQRGEIRPNDPNVITLDSKRAVMDSRADTTAAASGSAAATSTASPSNQTVSAETAQAIIAQSHLHRLVMGIKNPTSTGQDMYDYLRNAWPEILDELVKFNKDQLLAFFKSRDSQMQYFQCDILTQVADDPRLPQLLEDFLRIAKDAAEAEKIAASSTAVV
jgi:hypothetical protein